MKLKMWQVSFIAAILVTALASCAADAIDLWVQKPVDDLITELPFPLYVITHRPANLLLNDVLVQSPQEKLNQDGLGQADQWSVQTIYGSSPNQVWIYISQDVRQIQQVDEALGNLRQAGNIPLKINGLDIIGSYFALDATADQESDGGALLFSVQDVQFAVFWQTCSLEEIVQALNSLAPLSENDPLINQLEQERESGG